MSKLKLFSDFFSCEFVVEGAREDKCFFKILVMLLPIVSYEYCPKIVPFMKDELIFIFLFLSSLEALILISGI